MLKPLLFILIIVMLIALALNFNFFSDSIRLQEPIVKSIKKIEVVPQNEENLVNINVTNTIVNENNLSKELQELLHIAQKLFKDSKDAEALLVYDEIIAKSKNSSDIKILKLFAEACFNKANIYYAYPSYDIDSAIESYELIINNFKNQYNKDLLITYMTAKIQISQFTSKDEILLTYDELIEKFTNDFSSHHF